MCYASVGTLVPELNSIGGSKMNRVRGGGKSFKSRTCIFQAVIGKVFFFVVENKTLEVQMVIPDCSAY